MKFRKELVPVLLLASGAALTVCGLAVMVAYGAKAPIAALAIWTLVVLFSRKGEEPEGAGSTAAGRGRAPASGPESLGRIEEARRSLVLASGLMAVIFLGAILALLLYLHVIVGCLRSWQLL